MSLSLTFTKRVSRFCDLKCPVQRSISRSSYHNWCLMGIYNNSWVHSWIRCWSITFHINSIGGTLVLPWKINRSRSSLLSTFINQTNKNKCHASACYTTTCLVLDWNWNIQCYLIFFFIYILVVVRLPRRNQEIVYKCAWLIGI